MNKHAYLIMAHHRPDLLQELIYALDDIRNDIIIHIDKKSDMIPEYFRCNNASLYFTERISVSWGGYTQIECEYILLKFALSLGEHSYYHFLTGVNYPLYNQDYIYRFFDNNAYQYIGYDNGADFTIRAKYYIPFSEYGKLKGIKGRVVLFIRRFSVFCQKLLKVNRLKKCTWEIKKGCAYFSITEKLVKEIIKQEETVKNMFAHTLCCDEVFVQTIAYNCGFLDEIFDYDNEWNGAMRELAWPSNIPGDHPGWNFTMNDINYLLASNRLFAMKFESPDGIKVIEKIKEKRNIV